MYHSITIGGKNTWDDWHLIPTTRPIFAPPKPNTYTVEVPGYDGILDLSTALAGRPTFGQRTGSFEFYTDPDFHSWEALYSEIMAHLHGKKLRAVLEDDPNWYYEGRFEVGSFKSGNDRASIAISYSVAPYKRSMTATGEWLWDTFNFETDMIRSYRDLLISGTTEIEVVGGENAVPTIVCTEDGMGVTIGEETYSLKKGDNIMHGVVLDGGKVVFTFTGSGRVTIEVSGGKL